MPDKFVSKIRTPFGERKIKAEAITNDLKNELKNVFLADIGTTPYNDVLSAYNDGKIIIGKYAENTTYGVNTRYFPLLKFETDSDEGNYFEFGAATGGNVFTYWNLHVRGGWGGKTTSEIVVIDDHLNAQSGNPVSNSALYAVIGDVETLLAAL